MKNKEWKLEYMHKYRDDLEMIISDASLLNVSFTKKCFRLNIKK